jgi:ribosomal protein S18 acetylase RimI-like enzyme
MLSNTDIAALERATLDAVAPQSMLTFKDWLLPFDHSTIGRAKSAVPLRHEGLQVEDLDAIFAAYAERGMPAHFRLAARDSLQPIYGALAARGYTAQQPTQVQVAPVQALLKAFADHEPPACVQQAPDDGWTSVYMGPEFDPVDAAHRVAALSRSPVVVYATLSDAQGPAAAGTASFSQGWAGIHGMRTAQRCRGKGMAGAILKALATQAQSRGLERVFLQVDTNNSAALALYQKAGFQTEWTYHYWRPAH